MISSAGPNSPKMGQLEQRFGPLVAEREWLVKVARGAWFKPPADLRWRRRRLQIGTSRGDGNGPHPIGEAARNYVTPLLAVHEPGVSG